MVLCPQAFGVMALLSAPLSGFLMFLYMYMYRPSYVVTDLKGVPGGSYRAIIRCPRRLDASSRVHLFLFLKPKA